MSKHTPGPWRFNCHPHDGNYMRITCSNDLSEGDNLRGYCGEANARLIAAAPDLLDALIGIAALYDSDEGCRTLPQYIAARAAIAKATGEQP